ncbi:DUF1289 domain-containing protein [Vreelandella rituensis]|uniref:DUF1289 domain-containing protein n=1 Tax=Vreelandella rituensis TaxID=2282306 RepID=A0A368U973_9GAMM|nr:DUF1289 domain-containing protein [Halomonas rituensis]RCV93650.1 DUF1289 domain-containing protein [Halomonas rituensis]
MVNWPDPSLPPINLNNVWHLEGSPCVGRCELQEGVCQGCKRTQDEIQDWSLMDRREREAVKRRIRLAPDE